MGENPEITSKDYLSLFKNLFVATKLQNVAEISNSASQKALDLFLKCRYLDEKTGGKGVIFATGTPIITGYQRSKMPVLRCLSKRASQTKVMLFFL